MSSNFSVKRFCKRCSGENRLSSVLTAVQVLLLKPGVEMQALRFSDHETAVYKSEVDVTINDKPYLTVIDVARLLNSSDQAIDNMINDGKLTATKLSERKALFRRVDVDQLFVQPTLKMVNKVDKKADLKIKDCYTMAEAITISGMSGKALYEVINRNNIEKKQIGKYVYVPKLAIHKVFSI